MSRARPIRANGQELWVDMKAQSQEATEEQLELLATVENLDLDELFDEALTQGEVVKRLRDALGDSVPESVRVRKEKLKEERQRIPECRICGKKGDSTKHHFINRWILRELDHYALRWADKTKCTIPVCIHCHRNLHSRTHGSHSIVEYLDSREKAFAESALKALSEERPKILILLARGDTDVYETKLVRDWIEGKFSE